MDKFLEMFHLVQGGRRWYEMENSQGFFILGASQRHIHMLPVKGHSEKGDSEVSDGKFLGNFQMGEGWGYGVWDENGEWWGTSKNE